MFYHWTHSCLAPRPDLNPIRPCLVKIWSGPRINFLTLQKLSMDSRYRYNCTQFCCYYLIWDTAFWIQKPYIRQRMSSCTKWTFKCLKFITRHKEALTGQKMLCCSSTFSGSEGPRLGLFCGDPVWPNMLNIPNIASDEHLNISESSSVQACGKLSGKTWKSPGVWPQSGKSQRFDQKSVLFREKSWRGKPYIVNLLAQRQCLLAWYSWWCIFTCIVALLLPLY